MGLTISIAGLPGYGDESAADDTGTGMDVLDAAYLTAQRFPGGVPALAQRMGVSANTLQHKLNPNNDRHILGLQEALIIQTITGNASVLHAMASALGYTAQRAVPDQSGGDPLQAFWRFQQELGDFSAAAAEQLKPGAQVSRNAQRRLEYHANEVIAAINHLVATASALVPGERCPV